MPDDPSPLELRFREWEPRRSCGTCTACCSIFTIEATNSPAYRWCEHCTPGVGCAVYTDRPAECRNFFCLWRTGFGTDDDRPDRHGVVIDLQVEPDDHLVIRVWRPRYPQPRQLKSAQRMEQEIWDQLVADGYAPPSIEIHGPPGWKVLRWNPKGDSHAIDHPQAAPLHGSRAGAETRRATDENRHD
jgi:hypothetical protein